MVAEVGALTASCALLFWLSRGVRPPEPLHGAFVGPWPSFLVTVAAAWLVPGFVLHRLARGPRRGSGLEVVALSFGLGLAWLAVPAAVALVVGTRIDVLAAWITGLNGALLFACVAAHLRDGGSVGTAGHSADHPVSTNGWLAAAAAVALVHLLAVSARRPRFSFGSDEWILMRAARYFLEAQPIAETWDFDAWDLVIALLVRLARVDLIDAYRLYLPPVLIVAASCAFLALAEALFRDRAVACFSYLILALYCLSDMQTRGEGMGMGLLVRIMEDKYAAFLIVVPLTQAAFVAFLRRGEMSLLGISGVLFLVAVLVQPLSLVWLALSVGATYVAGLATGRVRARPQVAAALVLILAAACAVAWSVRALRVTPYFALVDPAWPMSAVLLGLSRRRLLILSLEDGWYMAHPALLAHPLTIAAVLCALALIRRFRRSLRAQFLVCSTLLPILVVYNPLTARLLGRWITPWMIHRVLWMVPVALTLGYAVHCLLSALQRRLDPAVPPTPLAHGRYVVLWLAAIGLMWAPLAPRVGESWRALKARNRVGVTAGERELMYALARDRRLAGRVLAPRGISIRLSAWTSRLDPYPGLDDLRLADPQRRREWAEFYAASSVGEPEAALLRSRNIDYVITRTGTPVDIAIRARPGPFRILYDGAQYAFYDWRPEFWVSPPAAVTSFDTPGGNLHHPDP